MITTRPVKVVNYSSRRETPIRRAILHYFKEMDSPIDYSQIALKLNENGLVANKSTIYRQINSMILARLIVELDFGEGKKRYEIKKERHQHLICTNCHKIICIELPDKQELFETEISKQTNFKVNSYSLDFFGICESCRSI